MEYNNKLLALILVIIFFSEIGTSQVNQYSKLTPARYQPITDLSYYEALAKQKAISIYNNANSLNERIVQNLRLSSDWEYKQDMIRTQSYLKPILNFNSRISISNAEWRYKKARKTFNKGVRKYNKRLKKRKKNYKSNR